MARDGLRDREKALEEEFFARENRKLLERMREKNAKEDARAALAEASGIGDAQTLDSLIDAGIAAETWAALALVPLVEVAWANGKIETAERRAVLSAAEANGIVPGSPAATLLESWLAHRPGGRLLEAWGQTIIAVCERLGPAARDALRDQVLGRARDVAKSAGGFMGIGNKVSPEEEIALQELAKAFARS